MNLLSVFSRVHLMTLLFAVLCYGSIVSLSRDCCAGTAPDKTPAQVNEGPDGAKLWAQTCSGCHNLRPPNTFSGAQWEVIVHHMRVRARLTKAESQSIVEFLKSGK
jgi:hypothetical protein